MEVDAPRSAVIRADFFKGIGYSTVWEDERTVADALQPQPGDRVLSITSGGDLCLRFLLFDVAEVRSLDFNPHQSALLEFKKAAVRQLEPDEVWEVLGFGLPGSAAAARPGRAPLYAGVRAGLPAESAAWWDARPDLVARGPGVCGRQDRFLHGLGRLLTWLQGPRTVERFLACGTAEEQRRCFDDAWNNLRWRCLARLLFRKQAFSAAFDRAHFKHATSKPLMRFHVERVLRELPARDNFYLHYLFRRTYPNAETCPAWLRPATFATLRQRLDRLVVQAGEFERCIFTQADDSIDCFNLSNIFDWMSADVFERVMREVARVGRPGARLCYWTNALNTPRRVDAQRHPEIVEDTVLSERLFAASRTPGYSGCVVARIRK